MGLLFMYLQPHVSRQIGGFSPSSRRVVLFRLYQCHFRKCIWDVVERHRITERRRLREEDLGIERKPVTTWCLPDIYRTHLVRSPCLPSGSDSRWLALSRSQEGNARCMCRVCFREVEDLIESTIIRGCPTCTRMLLTALRFALAAGLYRLYDAMPAFSERYRFYNVDAAGPISELW